VTKSKLHPGAVTSDKLADGAVETRNLSTSATLAMAGVVVYNDEVRGWFNRFGGGQPVVGHAGPGTYELFIPGVETAGINFNRLLNSVSLAGGIGPTSGEISARWTVNSAGDNLHPIISTFDSSGSPADRAFTYLVYAADQGQ
jgi:hypothetical protein